MTRSARRTRRTRRTLRVAGVSAAALLALSACSSSDDSSASSSPKLSGPVTVFAAASLKESFTTLGKEFEEKYPGTKVTYSFSGSDSLAASITGGAPADVFASASPKTIGKRRPTRGLCTRAQGSASIARSRSRNFANPRTALSCRAADRAPSPALPRATRYVLTRS